MTRATTACRIHLCLSSLLALLLLLAGCSTLNRNAGVIRAGADARLTTWRNDGLFLTTVRIGDREASPFLVDTGASGLVIDSELAKAVSLSFRGEADFPEVKQVVKVGTLDSLEVGPVTLQNTDVMVMDLFAMTPVLGERLAGLLGRPFFAQVVVEVDYPSGSVVCFDPKTYRLPRGKWLPLSFQAGRPIVTARLEGNIEARFLLDTGANSTVILSPDFVRTHASLSSRQIGKSRVTYFGGTYEAPLAEIEWFEVAGHRFEKPKVAIAPPDVHESALEEVDGIIGSGLLQGLTIVFNYPEAKIAFLPE